MLNGAGLNSGGFKIGQILHVERQCLDPVIKAVEPRIFRREPCECSVDLEQCDRQFRDP